MHLVKVDKVVLVLVVLGAIVGSGQSKGDDPKVVGGQPQGQAPNLGDPPTLVNQALPGAPQQPPPKNDVVTKILNGLGLSKKAKTRLAPVYIPTDLTGKSDEEIMNFVKLLMDQRRKLQRRLSKHMTYTVILMAIGYLYHTNALVNGATMSMFALNNSYRETINADWMVHQEQLADFIIEYRRVKKIPYNSLPKAWFHGVPVVNMEYSKGHYAKFPVWKEAKDGRITANAEVRNALPMVKNWWLRK